MLASDNESSARQGGRADFLVVVDGPDRGKVFPLRRSSASVGRARDNDVVLDDSRVSRWHVRLTRAGHRYRVEDLGSANGTRRGEGDPLRAPLLVGPHEQLRIGRTTLELRPGVDPAPASDEPTLILQTHTELVARGASLRERLLAMLVGTAAALWLVLPLLLLR